MKRTAALGACALLWAASCFQSVSPQAGIGESQEDCATCRRPGGSVAGGVGGLASSSSSSSGSSSSGGTAGVSAGASGSSTSSGGSSGASSSGSTGGSTGGTSQGGSGGSNGTAGASGGLYNPDAGPKYICPATAVPPTQIACSNGAEAYPSQTVDFLDCTAVGNAQVSAIAPSGVPYAGVAAVSDPKTGAFALCLPETGAFTLEVTASQYADTYFAEVESVTDTGLGQLPLVASNEVGAVESLVPGGYVATDGLVILKVDSTGVCDSFVAGWTASLALPDGGSFPDGGYQLVYTGTSPLPDPQATSTSSLGLAIFYNIDTSISSFVVPVLTSPPGNTICQPLNQSFGFTGRIFVAAGTGSVFPVLLP